MKYFHDEKYVSIYTPPGHSGTYNRRLVGSHRGGIKNLEVIIGEMDPGGRAEAHAHPDCEQVMYIISGRMSARVGDEQADGLEAGNVVSIPVDTYHEIVNSGPETLKFVLIYSPPKKGE